MMSRKPLVMTCVSLLLAVVLAPSALAASVSSEPAAVLGVNLNFSPNPVTVGSQTQIQVSISGGSPPFYLWFNTSIPGCSPPQQPFQQSGYSSSYGCNATTPGSFPAHLDVADNAGDHGSASATLNVQSGGTGGSGSGTGNNTGGIDLSFLQNLLPIVMVSGILFVGSAVAIAVSAVALAILVPRRLKQLRKAIEGQPIKKTESPTPPPPPPKEQPPSGEL